MFIYYVTDFGIPSGRQDPQGVCTFIYNSSEVSNGTFTTPNYPGVYPRDTECHYLFYGKDKEKIHIQVRQLSACSSAALVNKYKCRGE